MKQIVKARIVLAHADTNEQQIALPNELILYDFEKPLANNLANKEIRLRIGDGTTPINILSDLTLDNMNFYNSKPANPETGDVWYNEAEETFYLENSVYEKVEITKENYKPNIYYKWLTDKYVLDTNDNWVENQNYYVLKSNPIKLSHVIENIEDGLGEKSIQTTAEQPQAYGNYSVALGYGNMSGAKAFSLQNRKYDSDDITQKRYYLNSVEGIAKGDEFSIVLKDNYDYLGKITDIDDENKYVTVDIYEVPNINDANQISNDSYLLIPSKPTIGDKVIGTGATATGYSTKALGAGAHSEGYNATAAGKYSHAEGKDTEAGYAGHAEGSGTTAKLSAHAEGGSTTAQGEYSHAEGLNTTANGHSSHAEGQNTVSSETASHAEGYSTKANGKYSHAEGVSTIANEMAAHAEGNTTEANGKFSHAEGSATKANGENSHAEGTTTNASGINSHAEGNGTTASGNAAHTEGQGTIASGDQAHAEGYNSQASYQAAHAEGYVTTATKIGAHAEGSSTEATGDGAHAEGYDTIASGPYSHAEGSGTTAVSFVTHAEGQGTIARGNAQHVQGKYNIDDTNKKYAHIVGNGTSEQRSNAHTLDWEGNAWYAGKIETGMEIVGAIGKFTTVNVASDLNVADKASIDNQGKGTFDEIATNKINVGENINLQDGNISTNNIQANNGHFVNGLTTGGEHYGTDKNGNQYSDFNPVLNFRGTVVSLDEITSPRAGDIVCIENLVEQKLLGFKVPKYDNFEDAIGTATKRVFSFLLTSNPNEYNPIAFSNYDNSPYNEILSYLLNDILYNPLGKPGYSKVEPNTDILKNRRIKIDFGPGQKNSLIYINKIEWHNSSTGQVDENGNMIGLWSYEYYGTYDENGKVYKDFKNYDVTFSVDDMPLYENIPENMKKYAVVEPEETSNYFIYDADTEQWNDLTYNGKQLEYLIASSNLVTIGYSNYNNYIVNKNNSIINCIYQACQDGYYTMYIEPGIYYANENLTLPEANVTLIGLGKVIIDFAIQEADNSNGLTYTFYNLEFRKKYTNYVFSDGEIRYWNVLNCNNCIFKEEISVTEINADRCEFYKNILCPYAGTNENIVKDSVFYQECTELCFNNYYNCVFYIDSNISFGIANNNDLIFDCCKFYIFNLNVECYDELDLIQSPIIKNSSFLQYPFANIECIDEETCYINSNVNYEDKDLHYKGITSSEELNKIVEKTEGDLYNVEEDVYKNGVGSIYYKITPQDQNYSDAITCIGEYNNYNDYRITGVTGGFANIITDLYNISEGITQLTDKIQINLYSEIFDETLIIPYEAHLYYNDLPDNKVQAMYELCFHYYGYDRANKPIDWFSSSIQGYFITSSSLNYATKDYEKIHHTEKIDSREKIGVTNSLKVYKEDDWENLIKGIPLNYKGQLEKYSYLPENKNIGDLYSVLSTTKNIYNRDQSGTFLGYNSLVIGQGDITFTNNDSDNNTFILTLSENTELRKILCHYVGAYDFGTKNYKSINLSFNNYKGIELIYSQSPEYNYFKIYKVEYNGDKNEIKIEGEVSAYETTYPPYTFAKGETMSIRFSNSATLINDYLNKSIYINSYPSGKWFWDGIEWVFFDQKEIFTDQIQYSTRDIEKNSNLKTGTLYIVYEEDDE